MTLTPTVFVSSTVSESLTVCKRNCSTIHNNGNINCLKHAVGNESTNLSGGFQIRGNNGSSVIDFASARTPS
ncbi:unnamed protein product [Rotaria magnacalcarata]|uniref:Uncharacterized protein n=1 Tax=Rotaria magnacalcarata TaxID=392030 RepID=A0A816S2W1_9BILA|nr:unnamed protein product [Rotaria magnacalcarata]